MAALYNLIVCTLVAVGATLLQNQLKKTVTKLKKNKNHNFIMTIIVTFIAVIVIFNILNALLKL